jgi:hypothetical protein
MTEEPTTPDLVELVLTAMPAFEGRDLDAAISFWGAREAGRVARWPAAELHCSGSDKVRAP